MMQHANLRLGRLAVALSAFVVGSMSLAVSQLSDIYMDRATDRLSAVRDYALAETTRRNSPRYKSAPKTNEITAYQTFVGFFRPAEPQVKLVIFSDDACDVFIDGERVWPHIDEGQHLPNLNQSFQILPLPGRFTTINPRTGQREWDTTHAYFIRVEYSNICHPNDEDIDGCTLFACEANEGTAGTVLAGPDMDIACATTSELTEYQPGAYLSTGPLYLLGVTSDRRGTTGQLQLRVKVDGQPGPAALRLVADGDPVEVSFGEEYSDPLQVGGDGTLAKSYSLTPLEVTPRRAVWLELRYTINIADGVTDTVVDAARATLCGQTTPVLAWSSGQTATAANLCSFAVGDPSEPLQYSYMWQCVQSPDGVTGANRNLPELSEPTQRDTQVALHKVGTYRFRVTVKDGGEIVGSADVEVVCERKVQSLTVSPAGTTVQVGRTQQFVACVYDQFGDPWGGVPPDLMWRCSGGGTISATGLYTAPGEADDETHLAWAQVGTVQSNEALVRIVDGPKLTVTSKDGTDLTSGRELLVVHAPKTYVITAETDEGTIAQLKYKIGNLAEVSLPIAVPRSSVVIEFVRVFSQCGDKTMVVTAVDSNGRPTEVTVKSHVGAIPRLCIADYPEAGNSTWYFGAKDAKTRCLYTTAPQKLHVWIWDEDNGEGQGEDGVDISSIRFKMMRPAPAPAKGTAPKDGRASVDGDLGPWPIGAHSTNGSEQASLCLENGAPKIRQDGGTWRLYRFTGKLTTPGPYLLYACVTDKDGLTGWSRAADRPVQTMNAPPSVQLVKPAVDSDYPSKKFYVEFEAKIYDRNGTIALDEAGTPDISAVRVYLSYNSSAGEKEWFDVNSRFTPGNRNLAVKTDLQGNTYWKFWGRVLFDNPSCVGIRSVRVTACDNEGTVGYSGAHPIYFGTAKKPTSSEQMQTDLGAPVAEAIPTLLLSTMPMLAASASGLQLSVTPSGSVAVGQVCHLVVSGVDESEGPREVRLFVNDEDSGISEPSSGGCAYIDWAPSDPGTSYSLIVAAFKPADRTSEVQQSPAHPLETGSAILMSINSVHTVEAAASSSGSWYRELLVDIPEEYVLPDSGMPGIEIALELLINGAVHVPTAIDDAGIVDGKRRVAIGLGTFQASEATFEVRGTASGSSGPLCGTTGKRVLHIANAPPVVEWVDDEGNPAGDSECVSGDDIPLRVRVTDDDGVTLDGLVFYANGDMIGEGVLVDDAPGASTTCSTYELVWDGVPKGTWVLGASASDSKGGWGDSDTITIRARNELPQVSISEPAYGAEFNAGNIVTVRAVAGDANGEVRAVKLFVDRRLVAICEPDGVEHVARWTATPGYHEIAVAAVDNEDDLGFEGYREVFVDSPTAVPVSITAPQSGHVISWDPQQPAAVMTTIVASVDDPTRVSKVEFYADSLKIGEDTTAPFSCDWRVECGHHRLVAVSVGRDANETRTTSRPVLVTRDGHVEAAARIVWRARGETEDRPAFPGPDYPDDALSVTSQDQVWFEATVSSTAGPVERVEYFTADGVAIGGSTDAEHNFRVQMEDPGFGMHTVMVKAWSTFNACGVSTPVNLHVTDAAWQYMRTPDDPDQCTVIQIVSPEPMAHDDGEYAEGRVGTALVIAARCRAADGVSAVEILANGDRLDFASKVATEQDGQERWEYGGWVPSAAGQYELRARVTTGTGIRKVSDPVMCVVIEPNVTVEVTSPTNDDGGLYSLSSGSFVPQPGPVAVTVSCGGDDDGLMAVSAVRFLVNGEAMLAVHEGDEWKLNGWTPAPGEYVVVALATRANGTVLGGSDELRIFVGDSEAALTPDAEGCGWYGSSRPDVEIVEPSSSTWRVSVPGALTVRVRATAASGETVESVGIYAGGAKVCDAVLGGDGLWQASVPASHLSPGIHHVYARAADTADHQRVASPICVLVDDPAPDICIVNIAPWESFEAGQAVQVHCSYTYWGDMDRLELLVNGQVVDNADPDDPDGLVWQPEEASDYVLEVRARTSTGVWGTSPAVQVSVTEPDGDVDSFAVGQQVCAPRCVAAEPTETVHDAGDSLAALPLRVNRSETAAVAAAWQGPGGLVVDGTVKDGLHQDRVAAPLDGGTPVIGLVLENKVAVTCSLSSPAGGISRCIVYGKAVAKYNDLANEEILVVAEQEITSGLAPNQTADITKELLLGQPYPRDERETETDFVDVFVAFAAAPGGPQQTVTRRLAQVHKYGPTKMSDGAMWINLLGGELDRGSWSDPTARGKAAKRNLFVENDNPIVRALYAISENALKIRDGLKLPKGDGHYKKKKQTMEAIANRWNQRQGLKPEWEFWLGVGLAVGRQERGASPMTDEKKGRVIIEGDFNCGTQPLPITLPPPVTFLKVYRVAGFELGVGAYFQIEVQGGLAVELSLPVTNTPPELPSATLKIAGTPHIGVRGAAKASGPWWDTDGPGVDVCAEFLATLYGEASVDGPSRSFTGRGGVSPLQGLIRADVRFNKWWKLSWNFGPVAFTPALSASFRYPN